jgi:hypothetical protein
MAQLQAAQDLPRKDLLELIHFLKRLLIKPTQLELQPTPL